MSMALLSAYGLGACSGSDSNGEASQTTGTPHTTGGGGYGASTPTGSSGHNSSSNVATGGQKAATSASSSPSDTTGYGDPGPFATGNEPNGPFSLDDDRAGAAQTTGGATSHTGAGGAVRAMQQPKASTVVASRVAAKLARLRRAQSTRQRSGAGGILAYITQVPFECRGPLRQSAEIRILAAPSPSAIVVQTGGNMSAGGRRVPSLSEHRCSAEAVTERSAAGHTGRALTRACGRSSTDNPAPALRSRRLGLRRLV
jgi:hypothetical protein